MSLNLKNKYAQKNLSIKQWSVSDQPREKLRDKGPRFLSNAELIAILIGYGTLDLSAVDLSKLIFSTAKNNLNILGKLSLHNLMKFKGLGEAKAIKIAAAMELGRGHKSTQIKKHLKINSSRVVFEIMSPMIGGAITRRILGVISKQFKCHCLKISVEQEWNNSHGYGFAFNL